MTEPIGRKPRFRRRYARRRFSPLHRYPERPRRRVPRIVFPSFFTLMNLLSGFFAIIQIHEGNLTYGCWLIVLAGFFDLLDGLMARLARATSPFGVELDSLSDIVSFGVAPGFLLYTFGLNAMNTLGTLLASLLAVTGAVRLARYNVLQEDHEQKGDFVGLPIPVAALLVIVFILSFQEVTWFDALEGGRLSILIPLVVILSALMVSPIRYEALPRPSRYLFREHPVKAILYLIALLLILFFQEAGLLITLSLYVLSGPFQALYRLIREVPEEPDYLESDLL